MYSWTERHRSGIITIFSPGNIFYDFGLKNLESALYELPEACRLLVLLADPENFSYKEIAAIVGCSRDAVMSGLFHSRRLLLKSLEKLAGKSEKTKIEPIAP